MPTKTSKTERGFDAVAESRRWKEIVAGATADMSIAENMAWFRSQSTVAAIRNRTHPAAEPLLFREDPPSADKR